MFRVKFFWFGKKKIWKKKKNVIWCKIFSFGCIFFWIRCNFFKIKTRCKIFHDCVWCIFLLYFFLHKGRRKTKWNEMENVATRKRVNKKQSNPNTDIGPSSLCVWSLVRIDITASYFLHSSLVDQIMQRESTSAVLWQNPVKHTQIFTQLYSTVSIGPSHMGSPTGFSQGPPQTEFSHILLQNLFLLLPPHFFSIRTLQSSSKR